MPPFATPIDNGRGVHRAAPKGCGVKRVGRVDVPHVDEVDGAELSGHNTNPPDGSVRVPRPMSTTATGVDPREKRLPNSCRVRSTTTLVATNPFRAQHTTRATLTALLSRMGSSDAGRAQLRHGVLTIVVGKATGAMCAAALVSMTTGLAHVVLAADDLRGWHREIGVVHPRRGGGRSPIHISTVVMPSVWLYNDDGPITGVGRR